MRAFPFSSGMALGLFPCASGIGILHLSVSPYFAGHQALTSRRVRVMTPGLISVKSISTFTGAFHGRLLMVI